MRLRMSFWILLAISVAGCAPPFRPFASTNESGAAGPTVAAIVDNILCELREAANLQTKIYPDPRRPDMFFTIKDRMFDINYIAQARLDIDVIQEETLDPSASFTHQLLAKPLETLVLNIAPKFGGSQHRNFVVNRTVDFEALNDWLLDASLRAFGGEGLVNASYLGRPDVRTAAQLSLDRKELTPQTAHVMRKRLQELSGSRPCTEGAELAGRTGLTEFLVSGIAASNHRGTGVEPEKEGAEVNAASGSYTYGIFSATVDFSVTSGIGGGPKWTLAHSLGGATLSLSRKTRDTLLISFVPACRTFRTRTKTGDLLPDYSGPTADAGTQLPFGLPAWSLALPACAIPGTQAFMQQEEEEARKAAAQVAARRRPTPEAALAVILRRANKSDAVRAGRDSNTQSILRSLRIE